MRADGDAGGGAPPAAVDWASWLGEEPCGYWSRSCRRAVCAGSGGVIGAEVTRRCAAWMRPDTINDLLAFERTRRSWPGLSHCHRTGSLVCVLARCRARWSCGICERASRNICRCKTMVATCIAALTPPPPFRARVPVSSHHNEGLSSDFEQCSPELLTATDWPCGYRCIVTT